MVACAGVLLKLPPVLTGFSPAIMVTRNSFNWSSIIDTECLVLLEDTIGKGSLVLALDFC